jgi:hypothetical protein
MILSLQFEIFKMNIVSYNIARISLGFEKADQTNFRNEITKMIGLIDIFRIKLTNIK